MRIVALRQVKSILTHDDSKTSSEPCWYEAITERDTAQYPDVRKRSLLSYTINIKTSHER